VYSIDGINQNNAQPNFEIHAHRNRSLDSIKIVLPSVAPADGEAESKSWLEGVTV
jgi:hypothetical protein